MEQFLLEPVKLTDAELDEVAERLVYSPLHRFKTLLISHSVTIIAALCLHGPAFGTGAFGMAPVTAAFGTGALDTTAHGTMPWRRFRTVPNVRLVANMLLHGPRAYIAGNRARLAGPAAPNVARRPRG